MVVLFVSLPEFDQSQLYSVDRSCEIISQKGMIKMFLGRNLCSPVVVGIGRFVSVGAGNYLWSEVVTVLERWSGQQQQHATSGKLKRSHYKPS